MHQRIVFAIVALVIAVVATPVPVTDAAPGIVELENNQLHPRQDVIPDYRTKERRQDVIPDYRTKERRQDVIPDYRTKERRQDVIPDH